MSDLHGLVEHKYITQNIVKPNIDEEYIIHYYTLLL